MLEKYQNNVDENAEKSISVLKNILNNQINVFIKVQQQQQDNNSKVHLNQYSA